MPVFKIVAELMIEADTLDEAAELAFEVLNDGKEAWVEGTDLLSFAVQTGEVA